MGMPYLFCIYPNRSRTSRILSAIVSDDTIPYALNVFIEFVVDTSVSYTVLTGNTWKTPIAMIGDPRKKKQKNGTKLRVRRDFPVCMKKIMFYYICMQSMCPNDYLLH